MSDLDKKARELLAAEYERLGAPATAEVIRAAPSFNPDGPYWPALRAIMSALSDDGWREALDDAHSALIGLHIATGQQSETAEKAIAKAAEVLRESRPLPAPPVVGEV